MSAAVSVSAQAQLHRLEMMEAQGEVVLAGNVLQARSGMLVSKEASLPMDALRFVYLFYPEQFKWRPAQSSTTYSFVDLDTLPPEQLAELQAAIGRNRFLLGSFHFILADYQGHAARISWKKLVQAGIDPLAEFLRHRESRLERRQRWLQNNPGITIEAKAASFRGGVSLNAGGISASNGKFIPWPFLADVQMTKETNLNTCYFNFIPLKGSGYPAFGTGVSPKHTETCLAEIHFWSSLGKAQAAEDKSLLGEMGLPTAAPAPPPAIPNSPLAGASLVSGILGWTLLPVLGALAAIVTGHLAFRAIGRSESNQGGKNQAKIGLALGYIQIALIVLTIIL